MSEAASPAPVIVVEDDRTGMSEETLRRAVIDHLRFSRAKDVRNATLVDVVYALSRTARDRLVWRWIHTQRTYREHNVKRAYYLSAEYLPGRMLVTNLLNLGLYELTRSILREYGLDPEAVFARERDPGLGNGGLGRLAACFLDSAATLGFPAMGYGIRYEFGIFHQDVEGGWQIERPDAWLRDGNPWEIARPEFTVPVRFGGYVDHGTDDEGRLVVRWRGGETVLGVPYDTPIAGFGNDTVNTLRLWRARASAEFELAVFNDGDYRRAVDQKAISESISKVLYPKDDSLEGKELRLKQQYFFVACSIADILRRFRQTDSDLSLLPERAAIQLNDTHPAIAVAELMRVLIDFEHLDWDNAWRITRRTFSYTNHTLLPEALEKWQIDLFERLLPRHMQIIYEMNHRFLRRVHIWAPGDGDLQRRMSLIDEGPPRAVRMAHLAVVGAHAVNGVAELHSRLLRERVLPDHARMFPEQFINVTNGVTPRRWILQCNMPLANAITARIGRSWVTDLDQLSRLEPYVDDGEFLDELRAVRVTAKERLAREVERRMHEPLDPASFFDVHVKRIHEYKRQVMACLHVVWLYWRIKVRGEDVAVPRTVLFGGKAAPGYRRAKHTIKLINDVASIVNWDPTTRGRLKILFLPNYNVSLAELVIPAADLSEQISLAGKEASGTGNMKFQMNGALTIGTLDGANIEIREAVGPENFFLFGMDAAQVEERRAQGYDPRAAVASSQRLQVALGMLEEGIFNPDQPEIHREIARYIREVDPFMVAADFDSYCDAQEQAAAAWAAPERWWPMAARNVARAGRFSSDRAVREYAERIWKIAPIRIEVPPSSK